MSNNVSHIYIYTEYQISYIYRLNRVHTTTNPHPYHPTHKYSIHTPARIAVHTPVHTPVRTPVDAPVRTSVRTPFTHACNTFCHA